MHVDVAILGAGAAGMMAAVAAAERLQPSATAPPTAPPPLTTLKIAIFEKNPRPGIKVLVCGGGRCNFTNAGTTDFLIAQFGRNGRFLTPALRHLDNDALRDFFSRLGVPSHVEPGGKVYPDSNQARSVVNALVRRMEELAVHIFTGPAGTITSLTQDSALSTQHFTLSTADGISHTARTLILAVGGMSYQRMGTVGDGYRFAAALGHSVITPRPAIVGLLIEETWTKDLQGLAVRDVEVTINRTRSVSEGEGPCGRISGSRAGDEQSLVHDVPQSKSKSQSSKLKTQDSFGDLLFTHFGLSGPAILNPSEIIAELLESHPSVTLLIDFARHSTFEHAHALLRRWQQSHGKKLLRKLLSQSSPEILITTTSPDQTAVDAPTQHSALSTQDLRLPVRLAEAFCTLAGIAPDQPCARLTNSQMHTLVQLIKRCPFTITATRGFKEAMVTAGGIKLGEVNPNTMESKIVPNLFLTGEVLDLTGPSGGYNLQLAFSTGHLAGTTLAARLTSFEGTIR